MSSAGQRARCFCQQWRHCYLLLAMMFGVVWRLGTLLIPVLENTCVMGGLHPGDVFLLMNVLKVTWLPLAVSIVLFAVSFRTQSLNTAAAVAVSGLCASALLACLAIAALFTILM